MSNPLLNVDQIVIILLFGVVGAKLADRFNLPSIIPLLVSGFLLGPEAFDLFNPGSIGLSLTTISTLLTPVILFNEGMHIELYSLNRFRRPVFLLATVGVVVTMLGVGLIAHYLLSMSLINSLLLGAILAATDPGAVHTIAKSLRIGDKISTIVEGESAFNDASALVLTTVLSTAAIGGGLGFVDALLEFIKLFFGGIFVGGIFGIIVADIIQRFEIQRYAISLSLAIFLIVFSMAETLGFSGITAVVAVAIIFGDTLRSNRFRVSERNRTFDFWRNILFLAQSIIFLVLGAGISYSIFTSDWLESIVIFMALFFVARPIAVFVSTLQDSYLSRGERWFISWVGARGAISAALASLVVGAGVQGATKIFNIVLVVVVVSLLLVSFTASRIALRTLKIEEVSPLMEDYFGTYAEYLATREAILELEQRFQEGGIDLGTLRELRGDFKERIIKMEDELESYSAAPEFAAAMEEEKLKLKQDLIQIQLSTTENMRARGELPESVYHELERRYNEELDKLGKPEPLPIRFSNIIRNIRKLMRT
jgi:cell volume regulation protein A